MTHEGKVEKDSHVCFAGGRGRANEIQVLIDPVRAVVSKESFPFLAGARLDDRRGGYGVPFCFWDDVVQRVDLGRSCGLRVVWRH